MELLNGAPDAPARQAVRSGAWSRRRFLGECARVASVLAAGLAGSAAAATEYQVKAAFLYNFGKFVEWPAHSGTGPLVIGLLCSDSLASEMAQVLRGKAVGDRPVTVKRVRTPHDAEATHILFISGPEGKELAPVIAAVRTLSVLTVGETEQFMKLGGIIRFYMDAGDVRFEISRAAAQEAKLILSSKLLRLARLRS